MNKGHNSIRDSFSYSDEDVERYVKNINLNVGLEMHPDRVVRLATRLMPELTGKSALDIGTGEGRWARFMLERGATRVIAIDTNTKMIETAQSRTQSGGVDYICTSIEGVDQSVNFANAFYVLNYIKDVESFLKETSRLLSDSGELLITTKTIELPAEQKQQYNNQLIPILLPNGHTIYSYPHSKKDYLNSLSANGFNITQSFCEETADTIDQENFGKYSTHNLLTLCKK